MTHPILTNPDSRAAVGALYSVNPEGTADLMMAFPEAVFSMCQVQHEGTRPKRAEAVHTAVKKVSSSDVGRLF